MKPSKLVPKFLAQNENEGCSLTVYLDEHNLRTIGIGHKLTQSELMSGKILVGGQFVEYKNGITQDQANTLCLQDCEAAAGAVSRNIAAPLSQYEFDALTLFVFNVGAGAFAGSTLVRLLNQNEYGQVPDQMRRWDHVGGVVSRGLAARREREILVWQGVWNG